MNLLLIGGLPPPIGGTTVLFKQLVDDLRGRNDICLRVINVSRPTMARTNNVVHALRCLVLLLWYLRWASVLSFHTSTRGAITFGPLVHLASRLFRRKWVFRAFGGDIDSWHQKTSSLSRRLFDLTVLQADAMLLERKTSVQYFQSQSTASVEWYPNSRHCSERPTALHKKKHTSRRFVFVGHVKPEKGIGELVQAATLLASTGLTVDIYGSLQDGVSLSWFADSPAKYCGPLAKDDVIATLAEYDALILPTYWVGEGYPGVILEAYFAGIPVIATRWGGIPEIVTDETGILVEPRDVGDLAKAMHTLIHSDHLLSKLRNGVQSKAAEFDADRWAQRFIDLCHRLAA
jgi:glycosyltransferase involved in cell wall biosynthesis